MENHWLTDLLALGESPKDGSPSVLHGLFSLKTAAGAWSHMRNNNLKPKRIKGHRQLVALRVRSPENDSVSVKRVIEVITVEQVQLTSACEHLRLETDFAPSYVLNQYMFGSDDISEGVFATVILGDFVLEEKVMPPKLLLL